MISYEWVPFDFGDDDAGIPFEHDWVFITDQEDDGTRTVGAPEQFDQKRDYSDCVAWMNVKLPEPYTGG